MADKSLELQKRILELELEIEQKDKDLSVYRNELIRTNQVLEGMIAQMANELKYATLIQKALSPTELPHIGGVEFSNKFVPGTKFGGDYFDVFEHEDKFRFGVVLSSASGYAMSALFLGILIKLAGQIEARRGLEPNKVLQLVAKDLTPNSQSKDHASLFYAVVDRRSFEVHYSLVGGISGFLQQAGKEQVIPLTSQAPAMTSGWSHEVESQKISLEQKDRLILATEGITQATNPQGEPFGAERLLKSILRAPKQGVHELRNEILYQVEQFTQKKNPMRDQTVMVVEVKDRVIKLAK